MAPRHLGRSSGGTRLHSRNADLAPQGQPLRPHGPSTTLPSDPRAGPVTSTSRPAAAFCHWPALIIGLAMGWQGARLLFAMSRNAHDLPLGN